MPSLLALTWMSWPGFTRNDGRSTSLAVDEDVAVHDELAGLRGGAGEAGTQHEGVQTHLEQLDQVLTGQAVGAAGLVERDAHLLLADAVLGAQTLLLAEADGVVAVLLALGAAVLTGSVGTLLEVLGGLRGERDAERAGEAGLAAVDLVDTNVLSEESQVKSRRVRAPEVCVRGIRQGGSATDRTRSPVTSRSRARESGFRPTDMLSRSRAAAPPGRAAARARSAAARTMRRSFASRADTSRSLPCSVGS